MNTLQSVVAILASIAAIIWGFYAAVTQPILKQIDLLNENLKALREDVKALRQEVRDFRQEITAKVDGHTERITRLEEQRFR